MAMTSGVTAPPPQRPVPTSSVVDLSFGSLWADRGVPGRRGVLLACVAVGVFAGLTLPSPTRGWGSRSCCSPRAAWCWR